MSILSKTPSILLLTSIIAFSNSAIATSGAELNSSAKSAQAQFNADQKGVNNFLLELSRNKEYAEKIASAASKNSPNLKSLLKEGGLNSPVILSKEGQGLVITIKRKKKPKITIIIKI